MAVARTHRLILLALVGCTPSESGVDKADANVEAKVEAKEQPTPEPKPEPKPKPETKPEPSPIDRALARCETERGDGPRFPEQRTDLVPALDTSWNDVVPLVDTLASVRAKMGEPKEQEDLAAYSEPYRGDELAGQPVLIYDHPGPWDVYVYLVRSDLSSNRDFHAEVQDRVGTIELLPEGEGPDLAKAKFGRQFSAREVMAADGFWVEHRASSGLSYSVYGSKDDPGRLNRVVYGASDCQRKAAAS